jgi:hypothetical protein
LTIIGNGYRFGAGIRTKVMRLHARCQSSRRDGRRGESEDAERRPDVSLEPRVADTVARRRYRYLTVRTHHRERISASVAREVRRITSTRRIRAEPFAVATTKPP